jgi:hypothetical protein
MVLNNEPIFNNCLIKTTKPKIVNENKDETITLERNNSLGSIQKDKTNNDLDIKLDASLENDLKTGSANILIDTSVNENLDDNENLDNNEIPDNNEIEIEIEKVKPLGNDLNIDLDFEDLDEMNNDDPDELKEVTINANLENTLESIQLKKPNQVYFELYVDARKKAKEAKKNAILAYLEVKNIKKTYMIDNTIDSDSDFDAEIDEVSESELENL